MKKRILPVLMSALLLFAAGCGQNNDAAAKKDSSEKVSEAAEAAQEASADAGSEDAGSVDTTDGNTLMIVTNPGIHKEILDKAQTILSKDGITLDILEVDDYMGPNLLVDADIYTANYFQHEEYMNSFNTMMDTDLVQVGYIHFEPMGIYPATRKAISELTDGDTIVIPEDASNKTRALLLLQRAGIIDLKPSESGQYTISDISGNPYGVSVLPVDASIVPSMVGEAALMVMNGNFARDNFLSLSDALYYEESDDSESAPYWNVIAVREMNKDNPLVKRLVEVLSSDEMVSFINDTFEGTAVA